MALSIDQKMLERINSRLMLGQRLHLRHFFLIRHGETQLNREQLISGQLDVNLNKHGRKQAGALGERLSQAPKFVYCSGLKRTIETARIALSMRDLPLSDLKPSGGNCQTTDKSNFTSMPQKKKRYELRLKEGLNERAYGQLEGKSVNSLREVEISSYLEHGVEDFFHFAARVVHCLCDIFEDISNECGNGEVYVFSHAGVIRILKSLTFRPVTVNEVVLSRVAHATPIPFKVDNLEVPPVFYCDEFISFFRTFHRGNSP